MSYTKLTGETFQKAHNALCEKRKQPKRKPILDKREVIQAIAIAVGIFIAFYALCAFASERDGEGWAVGNYRTEPCWND